MEYFLFGKDRCHSSDNNITDSDRNINNNDSNNNTIANTIMKFFIWESINNIKNVDGAMHFIYAHKYNTNSAEDSSDIN